MNLVDIDRLSHKAFQALDKKLKTLKARDQLPPVQVDLETNTPYIEVGRKCYPIEAMINRETVEKSAKIKLMRGRLLVLPLEESKNPGSKIIVVTGAQTAPRRGKVMGVGPAQEVKKKIYTSPVNVGDVIVYVAGGHNEVKVDGHKYVIVPFDDVLVKLT